MTTFHYIAAFVLIVSLAGCVQSSNMQNATVFDTEVGAVFARPYKGEKTWQAGPDKVGFSTGLTPQLKVASIQAIESASGCKVVRESISEQSALFVVATVNCEGETK